MVVSRIMTEYDKLCKEILSLSPQIRFAGVVNSKGEMIAGGHNGDVTPLLSEEDAKMSIHYALQKRELYTNLAYKIGPEKSSITEYGKVTMISIPINPNDLLLISTEPRDDYFKIIDFVYSQLESS